MSISKPTNPEELYKFFITGLPREPIEYTQYVSVFRRKGWNILTDGVRDAWVLPITYYSNWRHDKPDWCLNACKYHD